MKRISIMLTTISILAVAGSVLAFKVKRGGFLSYCITTITDGTGICTVLLPNKLVLRANPVTLSYRRINNGGACSGSNTICTAGGSALVD